MKSKIGILVGTLFLLLFSSPLRVWGAEVPDRLQPPEGHALLLLAYAYGVQIYRCQATPAGPFEWVFQAPEADLFSEEPARIGRHYAGPTWEATDGSKVVGQV